MAALLLNIALYSTMTLTAVRGDALTKAAATLNIEQYINKSNHTECLQALQATADAAFAKEIWALKMVDSWGRPNAGQMQGNRRGMFGDYKECISAEHPSGSFQGQFCMVEGNLTSTMDELVPLLKKTIASQMGVDVSMIQLGICIPSKCNGSNLIEAFENLGNMTHSLKDFLLMRIVDSCVKKASELKFELIDYVFVLLTIIIVLLLIFGTIHDCRIRSTNNKSENSILMAFSLYKNGEEIIKRDNNQVTCMHGLKSLSMIYIVVGHSLITIIGALNVSFLYFALTYSLPHYVLLLMAVNAVDTFFFMAAVLLVSTFLRLTHNNGSYDFPTALLRRYFRFSLPYGFLILFLITMGRFLMPLPLEYQEYVNQVQSPCIRHWPWALLYIKNYVVQSTEIFSCMEHGWYLDVDLQLFLISPALLYPVLKWPKIAFIIPIICAFLATNLELYLGIKLDMGPNPGLARHYTQGLSDYYAHTRSASWFLGIAFGFLLAKIHTSKITIPKKVVVIGWIICSVLSTLSFTLLCIFDHNYTQPGASLHLCYIKLVWSVALAWIITACTTGNGGIINDILSWWPFHCLSRISFSVYLIHVIVLKYAEFNFFDGLYVNLNSVTVFSLWASVFSILSGLVLALCIEMPAAKLTRIAFKNVSIFPFPQENKWKGKLKKDEETGKDDENESDKRTEENETNPEIEIKNTLSVASFNETDGSQTNFKNDVPISS